MSNIIEQLIQKLEQSQKELNYFKKVYEEIYNSLYRIKDSQLKEPVNNMEAEDLDIKEVISQIDETFAIYDKIINNLRQKLDIAVEALENINSECKLYDDCNGFCDKKSRSFYMDCQMCIAQNALTKIKEEK